ncbi:unnamed protein product [Caenorhabditis bovis]|uniref:Uncharacterized protein n=1 Tax=Caenorhabditis bovis TaxID=2654633 RepID=A0A8S1F3S8_9PELO|nr:unnamed protein product [Caenorhabditis bovis]
MKRENDLIITALGHSPPFTTQYQKSINELISLYDQVRDLENENLEKLVLALYIKLCANILSVLKKKSAPQLYGLAYGIADKIDLNLSMDDIDMEKWTKRILFECAVHIDAKNSFEVDTTFSTEAVVDNLCLSHGRLQFVRGSIFDTAKGIVDSHPKTLNIDMSDCASVEVISDEVFLRLIIWACKWKMNHLNEVIFEKVFARLPVVPKANDLIKSGLSLLDVRIFISSLSVISSKTTESGLTVQEEPRIASNLSLSKIQIDSWKALIDVATKTTTVQPASSLRCSQVIAAVRLTNGGSEDVRVLFEVWKSCLQNSAKNDEDVFEAINALNDVYRTKMNQLLAYGPSYPNDSTTHIRLSMDRKRDNRGLFPLQFDYEFVDVTEAEHIGAVINSTEGYEFDGEPEPSTDDYSFETATENYSDQSVSEFFSPMKHNRNSMVPESISKLIHENSMISTQSVILTPIKEVEKKKEETSPGFVMNIPLIFPPKIETGDSNIPPQVNEESVEENEEDDENEDEEEDNLEAALLECEKRHEESVRNSPKKTMPKEQLAVFKTPTKNAETATDDLAEMPPTPPSSLAELNSCNESPVLSREEDEMMMMKLLESSTKMLANLRMSKLGLKFEEKYEDDDIVFNKAQEKLKMIKNDIMDIVGRFHDSSKCLGCQTDDAQDRALNVLKDLAVKFDQEGRC